jgi:hypothetical protein
MPKNDAVLGLALDTTLARDAYWMEHFDDRHPDCIYCHQLTCIETEEHKLCHGYIESKEAHAAVCSCG